MKEINMTKNFQDAYGDIFSDIFTAKKQPTQDAIDPIEYVFHTPDSNVQALPAQGSYRLRNSAVVSYDLTENSSYAVIETDAAFDAGSIDELIGFLKGLKHNLLEREAKRYF